MNDRYSIGIDLGGTNLRVAAYCEGTDFLETISLPTRLEAGPEQVVRDLCGAVETLAGRGYGDREFTGVGMGTPGPLELPRGVLRSPPNLPGWDGFELRKAITSILGYDIALESDANVAALAEQKLGAGERYGVDTLCVLTLGTGVGNGIVLKGDIWDGANGMGGEAGHVIVKDEGGAECGCGGYGCLEQYASATAVLRMAREAMGVAAPTTARDVALLARAGNPQALAVFEDVGHYLAVALTGLINTLNLPLYLLGGGVCDAWDLFSPRMLKDLHTRSYVYRLNEPRVAEPEQLEDGKTYILKAQLGSTAGLLGACLLGLQQTSSDSLSEGKLLFHE